MADETTPLNEEAVNKVKENLNQTNAAIKGKLNDFVEKAKSEAPVLRESTVQKVKEASTQLDSAVKDGMNEFVETAKSGNTSIRGLALISGLALVGSSVYEIIVNLMQFQLAFAMIAFYSLVIGSMAVAMEVNTEALPYGQQIRHWLQKNVGIVQLSSGRGIFYLVAGSLQMTQDETSATLIGLFTTAVAVAYIVVGRRATMKVKALRASKYPTFVLRMKFNNADKDGDGYLSFKEFHALLESLNVDITYQGSEMLFVSLDRGMNGNLEFEEFQRFWTDDPLTLIPV